MRAFPTSPGYGFRKPIADSQPPVTGGGGVRARLRPVLALAAVVVCVAGGSSPVANASQTPSEGSVQAPASQPHAVFLTLPMAYGFADATHVLVEAQDAVREALDGVGGVRLVERPEQADVVLTVLGRGRGDVELTAALRTLDKGVISPPVAIGANERYIEAMLTLAACSAAATAAGQPRPDSCYSRVFVGLGFGDRDARRPARTPAPNSWEACALGIARDVRAWLAENSNRLRAFGGYVASRP